VIKENHIITDSPREHQPDLPTKGMTSPIFVHDHRKDNRSTGDGGEQAVYVNPLGQTNL
jgi:hypothetical protein